MQTNISIEQTLASLLGVISQPVRLQILLTLTEQPACVCHLEAALKLRQAAISQHLLILKNAALVDSHREGRFMYYRLTDSRIHDLLAQTASLAGYPPESISHYARRPVEGCLCPQCSPGSIYCHSTNSVP